MGYIMIIAAVCAAEALIRRSVRNALRENETKECPSSPVFLHRYHNYGMAGSRLKERPAFVKAIGIAAMGLLVSVFFALLSLKGRKGVKIGMALLLGGGLANLAERFLHGYVTDYIQFRIPVPRLRNLIYNAADLCIFAGGVIMFLAGCLSRES